MSGPVRAVPGAEMTPRQHLVAWSNDAIALMAEFQPVAQKALKETNPVVLDRLSVKAAQISAHMGILAERAQEFSAALLDTRGD